MSIVVNILIEDFRKNGSRENEGRIIVTKIKRMLKLVCIKLKTS
jgi:hypothetical protein